MKRRGHLTRRWSEPPPAARLRFSWPVHFHCDPPAPSAPVAHLVLVRPMRRHIITSGVALVVWIVAGCETVLVQDGVRISGRIHDISSSDIRAAVAADIAKRPELRGGNPWQIHVISRDEVHVYWGDGHDVLKRVGGHWRYTATLVTLS